MLGQITDIRAETEARIRQAMRIKNRKEAEEMEDQHRQEFEEFMRVWDDAIRSFQDVSSVQMEQMRAKHAREIEELRLYLEQATPL